MSIENVYARLQAAISECDRGVAETANELIQLEARKHWIKGLADGYRLALHVLAEEGIVPEEPAQPDVIPFVASHVPDRSA